MHDAADGKNKAATASEERSSRGLRPAPRAMFASHSDLLDLEVAARRSSDTQYRSSPWPHGYCVVVALTIWVLIFSGGLVTSKGVGLSVPDWPTTYGYNMFAFPISRWVGGIFTSTRTGCWLPASA